MSQTSSAAPAVLGRAKTGSSNTRGRGAALRIAVAQSCTRADCSAVAGSSTGRIPRTAPGDAFVATYAASFDIQSPTRAANSGDPRRAP